MFCQKCGKEMSDLANACPNCGFEVKREASASNADDNPSGGMKFLCFIIPILGLILYIVWEKDFPKKSSAYGKAALWGFILGTLGYIFLTVIGTCAAMSY